MDKLIKEFSQARDELIKAITAFPPNKRSEILFGKWNLQDVVAHFTGWDAFCIQIIRDLLQNKKPQFWGNIDKFNEKEVSKRKNLSWEEVFQEFSKTGNNFIKTYVDVDPELLHKIIWPGKSYTPLKIMKININHYQKAQLRDIIKISAKW